MLEPQQRAYQTISGQASQAGLPGIHKRRGGSSNSRSTLQHFNNRLSLRGRCSRGRLQRLITASGCKNHSVTALWTSYYYQQNKKPIWKIRNIRKLSEKDDPSLRRRAASDAVWLPTLQIRGDTAATKVWSAGGDIGRETRSESCRQPARVSSRSQVARRPSDIESTRDHGENLSSMADNDCVRFGCSLVGRER